MTLCQATTPGQIVRCYTEICIISLCENMKFIKSTHLNGATVPTKADMTHLIRRLSTFPSAIMISSLVASVSVGSPGMSPPCRALPRLYHSP